MRKLGETVVAIIAVVAVLSIIIGFIIAVWSVGKMILVELFTSEPQPVCYYKYVDANGIEGTGTTCKRTWDNIYCGNDNDAHLVVSFEKVCEQDD